MIDLDCVSLNLPCPETVFTFEEPFEGPELEALPFPGEVSRLGLFAILHCSLECVVTSNLRTGKRRPSMHRRSPCRYLP